MNALRIVRLFAVGLVCLTSLIAFSQDNDVIPQVSESVREFTLNVAESYEIQSNDKRLDLNRTPLLAWTNPVRKSKHGSVFVWNDQGRPEVIACIYFDTKTGWRHEFKSITTSVDVQASQGPDKIWSTIEPGIKWETIDDIDNVSTTSSGRLIQMRSIARTFSGSFDNFGDAEELRLLSQPLYRWDGKDSAVMEGAIFCLAQGTNPEILLILEATDSKPNPWRFAIARMTGYPCKASRNGTMIWECQRASMGGPGSTTYYNRLVGNVPGSPE